MQNWASRSWQKAMIAAKLRPYYAAQAKERMEAGRPKEGKEKIPEVKKADSRDEAGKAVRFD